MIQALAKFEDGIGYGLSQAHVLYQSPGLSSVMIYGIVDGRSEPSVFFSPTPSRRAPTSLISDIDQKVLYVETWNLELTLTLVYSRQLSP